MKPRDARDAVRVVPHEPEQIGDARRRDATHGAHDVLVNQLAAHAIDLNDACALHALPEVFVGRQDAHLLGERREACRPRRER